MKQLMMAVAMTVAAATAVADDAYLQSDKTQSQYIDLGYTANCDTRIELDMQLLVAVAGDQYFLGTYGDKSGYLVFDIYTASNGKYCHNCQTNKCNWRTSPWSTTDERRTVILDAYNRRFSILKDGVTNNTESVATKLGGGYSTWSTLPVFGAKNNDGDMGTYSSYKLFGCKIYEKDVLKHDFYPILWGGRPALRDRVTGDVRFNWGKGTLEYGGDIEQGDDAYLLNDSQAARTQFIDTKYYAKPNTRIDIDIAMVDEPMCRGKYIYGVYGNVASDKMAFSLNIDSNGYGYQWCCASGDGKWYGINVGGAGTTRRIVSVDAGTGSYRVIVDGKTSNSGTCSLSVLTGQSANSLALFGARFQGNEIAQSPCEMKFYGMKIYEGETLVRNFVPCKKGDRYGIKDTVNGGFYSDYMSPVDSRIQGRGDIMVEADDAFIQNVGNRSIDIGYYAGENTCVEVEYRFDNPYNTSNKFIFGPTAVATGYLSYGVYVNGGKDGNAGYYGWCCQKDNGNWGGCKQLNMTRQKAVLDAYNDKMQIYNDGVLNGEVSITCDHSGCQTKYPIQLFANHDGEYGNFKLYSCKIYESGVLQKHFKPYIKDGVTGIYDAATDDFRAYTKQPVAFEVGGAIETSAEECAYVRSARSQALDTGYLAKPSSRIEVDFAVNAHTNAGEKIFGALAGDNLALQLYASGAAAAGNFTFGVNGAAYSTDVAVDIKPHTAIIDIKNSQLSFKNGSTTAYTGALPVLTKTATNPLCLFGEPTDAECTTYDNLADCRVYAVRIYENDELVHHFLPYAEGTKAGFKDVVTGATKLGEKGKLSVGCRGWGAEQAAFYENPQNAEVSCGALTATLSAFAPAASAYQWLKDGEVIDGATAATYSATYDASEPDAEYSCRATFDRYGAPVTSVSTAAKLTLRKDGFLIIVR